MKKIIRQFYFAILWIFSRKKSSSKRLLMVCDFNVQPISVGDFINFQAASTCLMEEHDLSKVDFVLIFDPIGKKNSPVFNHINEGNYFGYLGVVIDILKINRNLGSFFVFNSHEQFQDIFHDKISSYLVWPSFGKFINKEYLNWTFFNEVFFDYHQKFNKIPKINFTKELYEDAMSFFSSNMLDGHIPVTINLRNNPHYGQHRNSIIHAWAHLFEYCLLKKYPVKFFVICSSSEIDQSLVHFSNVSFTKYHGTRIDLELALIYFSSFHMGPPSGPCQIIFFNQKPGIQLGFDANPDDYKGLIDEGDYFRYSFSNENQKQSKTRETNESIIFEFERMFNGLNFKEELSKFTDNQIIKTKNWLK